MYTCLHDLLPLYSSLFFADVLREEKYKVKRFSRGNRRRRIFFIERHTINNACASHHRTDFFFLAGLLLILNKKMKHEYPVTSNIWTHVMYSLFFSAGKKKSKMFLTNNFAGRGLHSWVGFYLKETSRMTPSTINNTRSILFFLSALAPADNNKYTYIAHICTSVLVMWCMHSLALKKSDCLLACCIVMISAKDYHYNLFKKTWKCFPLALSSYKTFKNSPSSIFKKWW